MRIDHSSLPGMTVLTIAAVANRTYTVQYTDSLNPAGGKVWIKAADIVARPADRVETLAIPNGPAPRFWRIVLPAQP